MRGTEKITDKILKANIPLKYNFYLLAVAACGLTNTIKPVLDEYEYCNEFITNMKIHSDYSDSVIGKIFNKIFIETSDPKIVATVYLNIFRLGQLKRQEIVMLYEFFPSLAKELFRNKECTFEEFKKYHLML